MRFGINIRYLTKKISMEKAAEAVAKAGFTMLDYTPPLMRDDWKDVMKKDLALFKEYGLRVHQTHAPFNRYGDYGDRHSLYLQRCMEATSYMGAEYIAVHGDEFDFKNLEFSPERALLYNHDYFLPYVEQAERIGCNIAFETVFEDSMNCRRFTSDPEELLALIQSFQRENVVCCWDFGHAKVAMQDSAADYIRKFGSLIRCTHLHDNTGVDSHQIPLTGDIKWKEIIGAFKEIGYSGVMNIEYSHGTIPECLLDDFLRLSYRSVEYLWNTTEL